jgi:hypothetical protein
MNKNEIKYIEDHEPTPQELDNWLITLATDQVGTYGDMSQFYPFLMGWMMAGHHTEMAECARAWLGIHFQDKLEEFDSLHKG